MLLTKFKSNRLGEILMRKGIISREKIKAAIHEQNQRKKILHSSHSHINQPTCLDKILTELGFIHRTQLKRGLNWQLTLRKMAMALAFSTPLFGVDLANAATSTKTILTVPATIQSEDYESANGVKNVSTTDIGGGAITGFTNAGDWMNYVNQQVNIPSNGYYILSYRVSSLYGGGSFVFSNIGSRVTPIDTISIPKTGGWNTWITIQRKVYLKAGPHYFGIQVLAGGFNLNWFRIANASSTTTSSTSSSIASTVKSSSSSSSSNSIKSSSSSIKSSAAASSKAALDSNYTHVAGAVGLSWAAPKRREDNSLLDITELGGYQIRYKLLTDKAFTYITVSDPWTSSYNFAWLEGDYMFQIAAYDKLGTLSDFAYFAD